MERGYHLKNVSKEVMDFEREYIRNASLKHRRKHGQFFTPDIIADIMNAWITANKSCKTILDPALGLGAFFKEILNNNKRKYDLYGYEIDEKILESCKNIFSDKIKYYNMDFLTSDIAEKFDGIICNPPYLKFQEYESREIIVEKFCKKYTINLSSLTNLYSFFLIKALKYLNNKGRAAFIVPSEFMNADYGVEIKKYILESGMLRYIIVFSTIFKIFPDVNTTTCILLFENGEPPLNIEFINIDTPEDLGALKKYLEGNKQDDFQKRCIKEFKKTDVDYDIKWRSYYKEENAKKYKNIIRLDHYGKVSRGIATGANKYFMFNKSKIEEYKIDKKYLIPCISKAQYIKTAFFNQSDFERIYEEQKNCFLLSINKDMILDDNVLAYLKLGEELEINKTYLNSNRNPWYRMEKRRIPDIWVSAFNRNKLKFVLNETNTVNLTSFHGIYLKETAKGEIELLMAYFLTDVSREILEDNRREYGGGLSKFEPNDLNNGYVINLEVLTATEKCQVLSIYNEIKTMKDVGQESVELNQELNALFMVLLNKS